jgi:hypothetical protein
MTGQTKDMAPARSALATALQALVVAGLLGGLGTVVMAKSKGDVGDKGYDITPTGLNPQYPEGYECSPLTSLYASMIDVDGSLRDEPHSGVDAGSLGDPILAPGPGVVRAMWHADWGWGAEGALLIKHTGLDLNLGKERPFYYSEFDHLRFDEISHFKPGERIERGEMLAHVFRPGGNEEYLPEVHWEVWEIDGKDELSWKINKSGGANWINETARLIDPLYLLSRNSPPDAEGRVLLTPFIAGRDYRDFRGFTYILPCQPKPAAEPSIKPGERAPRSPKEFGDHNLTGAG